MISSNDFRTGVTIDLDGEVYTVVDFMHVKPGKGSAFVRSRLKNVRTGAVLERTFRAGEKVARARLDRKEVQFLYRSDDQLFFMDMESYEQFPISESDIGDAVKYIKEQMMLDVVMYEGKVLGADPPNSVELCVAETEPGVRGDTAAGGNKPAKLETGAIVQVPLFIDVGDVIRVDTRSGLYLERA